MILNKLFLWILKTKLLMAVLVLLLETGCVVSTPAQLRGHELIPDYPNLTTIPGPTFDPVEWTKQISIPGAPGAYNPSLVRYGSGYLLSARFDTMEAGASPLQKQAQDQMVFVKLNSSFVPEGPVTRERFAQGNNLGTGQDPRLFWWKNEVWVLFNALNNAIAGSPRRMVLAKLSEKEDGYFKLTEAKFLSYGSGPFEKNWPPFLVDNELYLLYNTDPHQVIKPDLVTGKCTLVAETKIFPWQRGHVRGGTPALPYGENEFISFFHSSKRYRYLNNDWRQIYVMGAYTFSNKAPFAVTRYTPEAMDSKGFYDQSNHWKIIFPTGLVLDDDYAYVSMGRNDNQVVIVKIRMKDIERHLLKLQK